jgi:hypothetical protein
MSKRHIAYKSPYWAIVCPKTKRPLRNMHDDLMIYPTRKEAMEVLKGYPSVALLARLSITGELV